MLCIYNTLSRKKEKFIPMNVGKINMYVCGVTLYDLCHIGHGRTFVIFDVIVRYLRYLGYDVTYVRNITDVDDKIIQQAKKNNESYKSLTSRMLIEMYKDFDALNILRPNFEPVVTNYINEIITFIEQLIKLNHAYITDDGDVMFNISSYSNYGCLSRQNINELKAGIRVKILKNKQNPLDFVLWKTSKINELSWSSPWGRGRPGWHIECSVMHYNKFGHSFDIHGGGVDLIFPHHENEIAQSVCFQKNAHINFWIHTGMIMIDSEKMSKSLSNVVTIRDILNNYNVETVRFFLLSAHYRSNLLYKKEYLNQAHKSLKRLYRALVLKDINYKDKFINNIESTDYEIFKKRFITAMNDDFNIPKVYSILFDLAKKINQFKINNKFIAIKLAVQLRDFGNILGLLNQKSEYFTQNRIQKNKTNEIQYIEELIQYRNNARKQKLWDLADIIREKLYNMNIILEDNSKNTSWYYRN